MSHGSAAVARRLRRTLQAATDLGSVLYAGKWLLLASVVVCTSLAIVIAYALPETYRAETLLKPARGDNNTLGQLGIASGLASLAGLNLPMDDRSAEARAVLESKEFSIEFVKNQQLLPVLFADDWDSAAGRWRSTDPKRIPTELDAYRMLRDDIRTVSQDPQSRMVLLAIEWKDPELAASWANEMVAQLNERMRTDALDRSQRNLEFLREEYEKTTVTPLRDAIARLMENELQTSMLSSVERDYAFRVVDRAMVPNRRTSPNRRMIAATGLALGLALGALFALAKAAPR